MVIIIVFVILVVLLIFIVIITILIVIYQEVLCSGPWVGQKRGRDRGRLGESYLEDVDDYHVNDLGLTKKRYGSAR